MVNHIGHILVVSPLYISTTYRTKKQSVLLWLFLNKENHLNKELWGESCNLIYNHCMSLFQKEVLSSHDFRLLLHKEKKMAVFVGQI